MAPCIGLLAACFWLLVLIRGAAAAAATAAEGDPDCWIDEFDWSFCCDPDEWGLTGNHACWNEEFSHQRCCGYGSFPWRHEDSASWSKLVKEAGKLKDGGSFDFIIVGAGSAGSVAAARLAESPGPNGRGWRILLLEEGHAAKKQKKEEKEAIAHPDKLPTEAKSWRDPLTVNWTVKEGKHRAWKYQTGKGLGGTAAVNSMIYTRGSVAEYANFGWPEEEVLEAFHRLEAEMEAPGYQPDPTFYRPSAMQNNKDQEDARSSSTSSSSIRRGLQPPGFHLTLVSAEREEMPRIFRAVITGFERANVPFRVDPHSSRSMHGIGGIWRSMGCGHPSCQPTRVSRLAHAIGRPRSSPYKLLVEPLAQLAHSIEETKAATGGITVFAGALVSRVAFKDGQEVSGVEVMHQDEASGAWQRIFFEVNKEVVLAAGVFGSPKILTLSGIAEPAVLEELGIPAVAPSPEVARNLREHVGVSVVATTSLPCPDDYHRDEEGKYHHLGSTADFMGQLYAFFNASDNEIGAAGPLDVEMMLLEGCTAGFFALTFTIILLQSNTLGRLVVQSRHAGHGPHVDFHPLNHQSDVETLANAVRLLYTKVMTAQALQEFELSISPEFPVVAEFEKLSKWIRGNLYYYAHPVGTCQIEQDGSRGVVNSQLQVLGTRGLRVADASVFPQSPSGHSDAPSRLAGEMVAGFILKDYAITGGLFPEVEPSTRALYGFPGVHLPLRGFGTNGIEGETAQKRVQSYLQLGGRLIDTALLYNNHADIARAITLSGTQRDQVFIVSKLPPMEMDAGRAGRAIQKIVEDLGTYVDLLLLHWPTNFTMEPSVPPCAEPPGSWRRCRLEGWQALEAAHREGKARAIGVSNFGVRHLQDLLLEPNRSLPIAANEVELHPWWPQRALLKFCGEHNIALIAYGSMGSSLVGSAMREEPPVLKVASDLRRSPAQVLLRWAVQQGVAVIPSSSSMRHMAENMELLGWRLNRDHMAQLSIQPDKLSRTYMPDPELAP